MRQKYWIKIWDSFMIDNAGEETLGDNYELYQTSSFFKFLWNLWKAYRNHKYVQVDVMIDGKKHQDRI